MARFLYSRVSGTWRKAETLNVKVSGTWQRAKGAWVKVAGTWQPFYPEVADGTVAVDASSSGSVVVPMGITRMQVTLAGGGGGGTSIVLWNGDFFAGGGGGSGGYVLNQNLTVIPAETITYTCGALGPGGAYVGTWQGTPGTAGGTTSVTGSFGASTCTGGGGGTQGAPGGGPGYGGAGGTPNGVAGLVGTWPPYMGPGGVGGVNALGQGSGGYGGSTSYYPFSANGLNGTIGHVKIVWYER